MLNNIRNVFSRRMNLQCLIGIQNISNYTTCSDNNSVSKKESVVIERDGPLTLIGINRPEIRNAIDTETSIKLCTAITAFEEDEKSTVGVLYGMGGSFCSGHDMNELVEDKMRPELMTLTEGSVGPTRRFIKKPIVCAINGYCVANGLELALMCDLRVMEDTAVLGFLNRRFGIPTLDGGTIRLPKMIGLSRALDLILTGRSVNAKEAFEMGISNRIVATGTSLGQSVNLAYSLAKFPQAALLHDRSSVYNSIYDSNTFDDAIQYEIMNTTQKVFKEAAIGASEFKKGIGRSGKTYNIKAQLIDDWETEEILIENKNKT